MLNTLENIKKADLIPQVDGSTIVSLADERDIQSCMQDLKEDKYLLLHEVGCKMIVDRKMHETFVGSACHNFQSKNEVTRLVVSELDHSIYCIDMGAHLL